MMSGSVASSRSFLTWSQATRPQASATTAARRFVMSLSILFIISETEVETQDEVRGLGEGLELRRRVAAVADREVALRIRAPVVRPGVKVAHREDEACRTSMGPRRQRLGQRQRRRGLAPFHERARLQEAVEGVKWREAS